MVNYISRAPLRSIRTGAFALVQSAGAEEEISQLLGTQPGKDICCERLHTLQRQEVEWVNGDRMLGSVIVEAIVSSLNLGRVPRAQDEIVRLGLLKQLLDCFKALWCLSN